MTEIIHLASSPKTFCQADRQVPLVACFQQPLYLRIQLVIRGSKDQYIIDIRSTAEYRRACIRVRYSFLEHIDNLACPILIDLGVVIDLEVAVEGIVDQSPVDLGGILLPKRHSQPLEQSKRCDKRRDRSRSFGHFYHPKSASHTQRAIPFSFIHIL